MSRTTGGSAGRIHAGHLPKRGGGRDEAAAHDRQLTAREDRTVDVRHGSGET
ncbi:hypothetical protein [Phytomonospora endophytica]|uniref:Uncharacterized protein n=1 Tax=Phytomonospora endophytica TaxID=714109 RepID=A0A841FVS4_9ACTN|nr:hypothetical protein [Phytomonospora endophytica]MBB6036080.1 hypothetical protein [Phytomonospora endophytica]GIG66985.1 hypothetical protein Pen01_32800 [Phytomonospora endophytica]